MNQSNEGQIVVHAEYLGGILQQLETREKAITVKDQASYMTAANFIIEATSYVKDVNSKLDPGINSAKAHLDTLKNNKAAYVDPVKRLIEAVKARAERWRADEKARADAEARRIQEEQARLQRQKAEEDRREAQRIAADTKRGKIAEIKQALADGIIGKREAAKRLKEAGAEEEAQKAVIEAVAEEAKNAPPPTVTVKPSVPTVAGIKNQTFYYAQPTDGGAMLHIEYVAAIVNENHERSTFLAQFIQVNEAAISKFARDTKDPDKVMKLLPGVRAWSKG